MFVVGIYRAGFLLRPQLPSGLKAIDFCIFEKFASGSSNTDIYKNTNTYEITKKLELVVFFYLQGEDMQISFNHIQSTISALRRKVKSRISLAKQVDQFSSKVVQHSGPKVIVLPKKVY